MLAKAAVLKSHRPLHVPSCIQSAARRVSSFRLVIQIE